MNRTSFVLHAAAVVLTIVFVGLAFRQAERLPFSGDESVGLVENTRPPSFGALLLKGAPNESSPSPLFHLLQKACDGMRVPLGYLGLPPTIYLRLVSILATAFIGLGLCLLVARAVKLTPFAVFLLLMMLATFFFQSRVFDYAARMRAYALWNSLTFAALVVLGTNQRASIRFGVLLLLAMSATAATVQIAFFAAAWFALNRSRRWEDVLSFAVPLLVATWYAMQASRDWGFEAAEYGTWREFMKFWLVKSAPQWILAGAAAYYSRMRATAAISLLALMAAGPVLYWLTRERNFFFTPRQYVYYQLATPVFLVTLLVYWRSRPWKPALVAVATIAILGVHVGDTARRVPQPVTMAGPAVDPHRLWPGIVHGGKPYAFCHPTGLRQDQLLNLKLLAEWIGSSRIEISKTTVFVVPSGETVAIQDSAYTDCPLGWTLVPVSNRP